MNHLARIRSFPRIGLALATGSLVALAASFASAQSASLQRSSGALGDALLETSPPPAVIVADSQPVARGGGPQLDEHFARPTSDGCTYRAHLAGQTGAQRGGYAPDVRVEAELSCPDGTTRIRPRQVRSDAMSGRDFSRALADAARVVRYHEGRACEFAPGFAVDGARVEGRGVNQWCERGAHAPTGRDVDERFTRDLDNGCEYRATVRGSVRETTAGLAPDLRVRASVHCANVDSTRAPERAIRASAAGGEALAERIDAAATVTTRRGDESCTFSPGFRVDATGAVVGRDVTYQCSGASTSRGGVYVPATGE